MCVTYSISNSDHLCCVSSLNDLHPSFALLRILIERHKRVLITSSTLRYSRNFFVSLVNICGRFDVSPTTFQYVGDSGWSIKIDEAELICCPLADGSFVRGYRPDLLIVVNQFSIEPQIFNCLIAGQGVVMKPSQTSCPNCQTIKNDDGSYTFVPCGRDDCPNGQPRTIFAMNGAKPDDDGLKTEVLYARLEAARESAQPGNADRTH